MVSVWEDTSSPLIQTFWEAFLSSVVSTIIGGLASHPGRESLKWFKEPGVCELTLKAERRIFGHRHVRLSNLLL